MKPRILIDPGSHHLLNLGDVAMMQVCVERLRAIWPEARIGVLTQNTDLLMFHCPDVSAVHAAGRYGLVDAHRPRRQLTRLPPGAVRALLRMDAARRRRKQPEVSAYIDAMVNSDLFVMSGRGGLTDTFADELHASLEEIRLATALDVPVALLGQGVGPIADAALRDRAAGVLSGIDLITLRESRKGPGLLRQLGVPESRWQITGDDSIALALRQAARPANLIGVSVRVAAYAGVSEQQARRLLDRLESVAEKLKASLVPITMSTHPHEGDRLVMESAAAAGPEPHSTSSVAERAGRCRVVATGSYHAGLFALAQGVPAVCFSRSRYYDDKFLGLREMFGDGCAVVRAADADAPSRVAELVERAYRSWPEPAAALRAAAQRQEQAGRTAYARLAALIDP